MADVTIWNPRQGVVIPAEVTTADAIASYARQLTRREVSQIVNAIEAGNFEMGALFLWQKTMTGLKRQLSSLGMDFVGELLDRPDIGEGSSAVQMLTDHDAVRLAEELGMLSSTQAMRLRNVLQTVAHFADSATEEEYEDDRQMTREEAIHCLRTCVQTVLGYDRLEGAIGFAKFRQELETRAFGAQDLEIESLKRSPYFFQRTTLRVLTALARTAQGAQLENVLANANVVIPALWDGLRKPDRWLIGRAYAEVHSEGRTTATSGLRKALLQVKGFDYVPEDLRSRTFLAAASELQSTHFGMNNFYNEPAAIRKLESLGTTIPTPALAECITAILCVKLGNRWGVSWSAQPYADRLLARLTDSRWAYYANECLPGDEVILGKLIDEAIVERWISLAKEYSLHKIEVRDRDLKKLFRKASEIAEIVNAARGILQKLTSERK